MKDLYTVKKEIIILEPKVYSANNTPLTIDLAGFKSAILNLAIGIGGITFSTTNKIEFVLTHSDDDSVYTNVTSDDFVNGEDLSITDGIVKSLIAAHATASMSEFGYIGNKRYLELLADFSGTHGTGTPISATLSLGHPNYTPIR